MGWRPKQSDALPAVRSGEVKPLARFTRPIAPGERAATRTRPAIDAEQQQSERVISRRWPLPLGLWFHSIGPPASQFFVFYCFIFRIGQRWTYAEGETRSKPVKSFQKKTVYDSQTEFDRISRCSKQNTRPLSAPSVFLLRQSLGCFMNTFTYCSYVYVLFYVILFSKRQEFVQISWRAADRRGHWTGWCPGPGLQVNP